MYLSQLTQHLQKDRLKPLYVAFGNNAFEIQEAVTALKVRAARDGDVQEFSKDQRKLADVMDALQGAPMFAAFQMVILQGADKFVSDGRKSLEAYLEHPSPTGVLVLTVEKWTKTTVLAKKVEKLGGDIGCWAPRSAADVLSWIARRAKSAHGKKISTAAAQLLADLCQDDLAALAAELAKLDLYVAAAPEITEEDVAAAVMSYRAFKPFDLADKLAAGDLPGALAVVEGLMDEGLPAVVLVGTLRSQFRKLMDARFLADTAGVPAAVSKFAHFPAQQDGLRRQLQRFTSADLVKAHRRLLEADLESKTSRYPERLIVERLLTAMAGGAAR
jgi:DNA polymerase-3 subunit delta